MRMIGARAWTGGQYSMFRLCLGLFLCLHFLELLPAATELFSDQGVLSAAESSPLYGRSPSLLQIVDTSAAVTILLWSGILAAIALMIGWNDRAAAVFLWFLLASLTGRNPLASHASLPLIGWLLLAHTLTPSAPLGSVKALGRQSPGGGWRMPWTVWGAAWVLMASAYAFSAAHKLLSPSWQEGTALLSILEHPLARDTSLRTWLIDLPAPTLQILGGLILGIELLFAPMCLHKRTRPWAWTAMLLVHLSMLVALDLTELSGGMLLLHLFTFDPGWWSRPPHEHPRTVFFDGSCGLCHRAIRLLLAEDPYGTRFRFAPLQGSTFAERVPEDVRGQLPDSLVVVNPDAKLRVKGEAVVVILSDLGGLWRLFGTVFSILPTALQSMLYDLVARHRKQVFGEEAEACPLMPPELRERFLP
jgi:predicted DCC family thiol-disulfide oxidoreductase YuxK